MIHLLHENKLVILAIMLYLTGIQIEKERKKLTALYTQGNSLSSLKMIQAAKQFNRLSTKYTWLEMEYKALLESKPSVVVPRVPFRSK